MPWRSLLNRERWLAMKFAFSKEQKKGIAYESNAGDHAVIHLSRRIPIETVKMAASKLGFKVEHHFKNRHQRDVLNNEGVFLSVINENLVVLSGKVTTRDKKLAVDFVNSLLEQ